MKKKLDGGLKKILFFFLFFIFSSKSSYGSQILDYETEEFLNLIIQDIIKVNKINKTINSAKPPIFWKDKEIVKVQLNKWKTKKIKFAKLRSINFLVL